MSLLTFSLDLWKKSREVQLFYFSSVNHESIKKAIYPFSENRLSSEAKSGEILITTSHKFSPNMNKKNEFIIAPEEWMKIEKVLYWYKSVGNYIVWNF